MENEKGPDGTKTREGSKISRMAKDFFLGCIAFIPFAVFSFVLYYMIKLFESLSSMIFGLTNSVWTTAAITLFIIFILIYTGRKLRRKEKWFLSIVDQAVSKIPVVGGWYATFRDMIHTFTAGAGDRGYLGTAKVPCGTGYMIGFVTKRETGEDGNPTVTVFVPTSPNPTTGLVLFFPEENIEYTDMPPEKAFTRIISLGMKS